MSLYGVKVYNDHSKIIIDDKYINHAGTQEGTVTTWDSGYYKQVTIDGQDFCPLIAIKPGTAGGVAVLNVGKTNNLFTNFILLAELNANPSIAWKVFNCSGFDSGDEYGFRIRDREGRIAFDSGNKPLAFVEDQIVAAPGSFASTQTFSHSTVDPYYVFNPGGMGVYGNWLEYQMYS
jgi:hypothetical protein